MAVAVRIPLAIKGTYQTVTETFTATGPGHSGSLILNDGTHPVTNISYVNLAPVDMTGSTIANLIFNLPSGGTTASLSKTTARPATASPKSAASPVRPSKPRRSRTLLVL